MTPPDDSDRARREELLNFLPVAGTLAGLCVTAVALIKTLGHSTAATIVDDMFAICALLFLVALYLAFAALRASSRRLVRTLVRLVDVAFLVALTLLTVAAFIMTYTVW